MRKRRTCSPLQKLVAADPWIERPTSARSVPSPATGPSPSTRRVWLYRLGEEALAWMERVLAMEPALHDLPIAKALFNKGLALGTLRRHDAAIAAYDDLHARFATDPAPALQEIVALVRAHRAGGAQNQNLTDGHSL